MSQHQLTVTLSEHEDLLKVYQPMTIRLSTPDMTPTAAATLHALKIQYLSDAVILSDGKPVRTPENAIQKLLEDVASAEAPEEPPENPEP